jgi:protocatechuate 3,4-dioxygenase beta subunit
MPSDESKTTGLRRRDALAAAGAGALGLGLFWTNGRRWIDSAGAVVDERTVAAGACTLTKELTEGPYWIPNNLTRRNVTEHKHGVPLSLVLTVEDASCNLLTGADVEIWHTDAHGNYSGVGGSSSTSRFMRGHQKTNSNGVARFETIYPGWYQGRTPHIHIKVHVGGNVVHTGQLFFKGSVSRAVYRTRYYKSRGQADTTNASDNIYQSGSLLQLTKRSGAQSYIGRKTLVVNAA